MKNTLQQLLVKPLSILPPPSVPKNWDLGINIILVLMLFCCSAKNISAQNPINTFASATYIGGYHIKCYGQSTGSIKAQPSFGTAPYTFLWSSGETSAQINNKPAGVYIVTITDSINVSHSDTFELRQPNALNYQSTLSDYYGYNIHSYGGNSGSIQLNGNGGTPPYTYLWSNGDSLATRNGLTAGNYSFSITDANQCSTNGNVTLTAPTPIQLSFTNVQNTQCDRSEDGAATLNVSGGLGNFSVVWSKGSFSLSPNDLPAGYNEVRIYEQGRAVIDTGVTINAPQPLELAFTLSQYANGYHVSCVDCFNGSITTTVTGGTAPYTYQWSDENSSTTANLINLNGGEYGVKITDAHGCKTGDGVTLKMPSPKDWSRFGNANIDTAEFIGSTDTSAVVFKTNSQEALRISGNGNVGVGTNSPTEKLVVVGNMKLSGGLKIGNEGSIKYESGNGTMGGLSFENVAPLLGTIQPAMPTCIPNWSTENYNFFNGYLTIRNQNYASKPAIYIGSDGESGIIESTREISGNQVIPLKINSFCGADLLVGNKVSGNLIANNNIGVGTDVPLQKLHIMSGSILVTDTIDTQNPPFYLDHTKKRLGIGNDQPKGALDIKTNSNSNIVFGSAAGSTMNWGSSYIGFNASRNNNQWTIKSDGAHNGGSMIYSNAVGDILFCNFGNTGSADQVLSDQTVVGSKIKMKLTADGRFGIGTDPALAMFYDYKFIVDGKIRCRKLRVDMDTWADMVFEPTYELMNLNELNTFIAKNKHLPNVPNESELKEKGMDISEMQKIQMQKIEELMLYVIQLNKENEALKKRIELIEKSK